MSTIEELIEICENRIIVDRRTYFWIFNVNFKPGRDLINKEFMIKNATSHEICQFIKICDNKLDLFKAVLNDLTVILGFDVGILSIIAALNAGKENYDIKHVLTFQSGDFFISLLVVSLIVFFIIIFLSWINFRRIIYLWTIFKEQALLMQ